MLRILILGNIAPYCVGGAEVQARRLAESFAGRGHQVTIAGYGIPSAVLNPPDGRRGVLKTVHLPTLRFNRALRALSYFISLSWYLLRHKKRFDLIYCRILGEAALVAAILKDWGLLRQPLVACSACAGAIGDAVYLRRLPFSRRLVALLNRNCDAVNVLSPAIEVELTDIGLDRRRFSFIPNGAPAGTLMSSAARAASRSPRRSFLFVGRLVAQKGVADLLMAVQRLVNRGLQPVVHIVGDGPLSGRLRLLANRLGIDAHVVFHGALSPDRLGHHYLQHQVFVLPSLQEGQSNALLEAMGSGLAVVVTRSGGSEFMVDESFGRICEPGDVAALAEAMAQMLTISEDRLLAMGQAARRHVMERFALEKVTQDYLNLFEKLLSETVAP